MPVEIHTHGIQSDEYEILVREGGKMHKKKKIKMKREVLHMDVTYSYEKLHS